MLRNAQADARNLNRLASTYIQHVINLPLLEQKGLVSVAIPKEEGGFFFLRGKAVDKPQGD